MPNFEGLPKEAEHLLNDTKKLKRIKDAPETQRVFDLLSRSAGDLEQAAQRAANGDAAPLTDAIRALMRDPEGAKLIQKMQENFK